MMQVGVHQEMGPELAAEVDAALGACRRIASILPGVAAEALQKATLVGAENRDVLRQVLLHLPFYCELGAAAPELIGEVATRCASQLVTRRSSRDLTPLRPPDSDVSLGATEFREIEPQFAASIIQRYHYLHSFRPDARTFGLVVRGVRDLIPIAVASISPFDLNPVSSALPEGIAPHEVLVVSRVLAFRWAPDNAISYLLRHVYDHLRGAQSARLLISYINPNVGFDGASLRSSGWWRFAYEDKPYYLYLDRDYVTERFCIERFGSSRFDVLQLALGARIQRSTGHLAPLLLYAFHLSENEFYRRRKVPIAHVDAPFPY